MRRVTWPLKERLSHDTWPVLQQLETEFSRRPPTNPEQRLVSQMNLLDRVIVTLSAFAGLLLENTTRNAGWRFFEIGKRLERGLEMSELLLAAMSNVSPDIDSSLETLLQIADSAITYRTRYFTTMRMDFVLELLLMDETNPRALCFQMATLVDHLRHLPGYDSAGGEIPVALQVATASLAALRSALLEELAERDAEGALPRLEDLMAKFKASLYDISDALADRHFSHLTVSRLSS